MSLSFKKNNYGSDNLIESIISVRRTSKVVQKGEKPSFSVLSIVGDGKGKIGYANGKNKELGEAKIKSFAKARSSMIRIGLKSGKGIYHNSFAKHCATKVLLLSAAEGRGIIAGSVISEICRCLGIKDIVTKIYGSTNPYNVLIATVTALRSIYSPRFISEIRGKLNNNMVTPAKVSSDSDVGNNSNN